MVTVPATVLVALSMVLVAPSLTSCPRDAGAAKSSAARIIREFFMGTFSFQFFGVHRLRQDLRAAGNFCNGFLAYRAGTFLGFTPLSVGLVSKPCIQAKFGSSGLFL